MGDRNGDFYLCPECGAELNPNTADYTCGLCDDCYREDHPEDFEEDDRAH